ncbi:hypothetical protein GCM10010515_72490 [Streptomyces fructofermentans]|uniref:Uncharacterized protein n=1 Tax=Streptomyces fructofermentans TaxID=152141 RepID=A0A918U5K9_9ACTN|nr:hypothetical protein GCM10010515_72490 [Streptomyces fructofermentans]
MGTDTPTPSAIWGSSPIVANSVVPMPNATTARARSAKGMVREPFKDSSPVMGGEGGSGTMSGPRVPSR